MWTNLELGTLPLSSPAASVGALCPLRGEGRPLAGRPRRGKSALAGRIGIRWPAFGGATLHSRPVAGCLIACGDIGAEPLLPGNRGSLWDSRTPSGCQRPVRPKGHTRRLQMPHGVWGICASTAPAKRGGVRHVASPPRTVTETSKLTPRSKRSETPAAGGLDAEDVSGREIGRAHV